MARNVDDAFADLGRLAMRMEELAHRRGDLHDAPGAVHARRRRAELVMSTLRARGQGAASAGRPAPPKP
jgi:hypothetical protein